MFLSSTTNSLLLKILPQPFKAIHTPKCSRGVKQMSFIIRAMEHQIIHLYFLQVKMRQLEQEAHRAAGQTFLITSSTQLRTVRTSVCRVLTCVCMYVKLITSLCYGLPMFLQVLFDKLCLHEHCENKKLPKTLNKQQQSTSEAAVWRA